MDPGWKIIPVLNKKDCEEISQSIQEDILNTTFGLTGEMKNAKKCPNIWQLFTDPKLREEYLDNSKCIWQNNFSQKPLVSKSCGMTNIYHNPLVREKILFNPDIINSITEEYEKKLDEKEEIIYAKGPERVSIKPKGSTNMDRHIDDNFQEHELRIQGFVTLQMNKSKQGNMSAVGSIEILSNFNWYFDAYSLFIENNPEHESETFNSEKNPIILDKTFQNSIEPFNEWLQEKFYSDTIKRKYYNFLKEHPLPEDFQKIVWEFPPLKNGDLFIWDSRCPHRNTKNKSDVSRIVAYVSLYPISTWEKMGKPNILNMFLGKEKSLNGEKNRDNREEKEFYKDDWKQRVSIDKTDPLIQKLLNLK